MNSHEAQVMPCNSQFFENSNIDQRKEKHQCGGRRSRGVRLPSAHLFVPGMKKLLVKERHVGRGLQSELVTTVGSIQKIADLCRNTDDS